MISTKKAVSCAETLIQFCEEQTGCQNCIFREFGAEHWKCQIDAFDLREMLCNIEAKRKNRRHL